MNKKGFSLIELLAVLAILGAISIVTITAVSRYISKSKTEKVIQGKKNVSMAAELYLQANRDFAPKAIGESIVVPLSTLKNKNYIKENLTNEKGEDCMAKSFVRVTKLSIEEYSYMTYLYCGKEEVEEEIEDPPVVFDFKFISGNQSVNGSSSSVKDAKFSFKMKGSKDHSDVGIYSYSYSIFTRNDKNRGEYAEVYNSGTIKGNFQPSIEVKEKPLSDYIDVTGMNDIRIDVTVVNEGGWSTTYSTDKNDANGNFQDTDAPVCGTSEGTASGINDWINKESFGAGGGLVENQNRSYPARITVHCDDNNGSGCKRDKFSRTWPNDGKSDSGNVDYKYGAIWSYIEIEDNAQRVNKTKCFVRVNVDLLSPTLEVEVYKAKEDGSAGEKILTRSVKDGKTITKDMPQVTILATDFKDLSGTGKEQWMNKENYPYGIVIRIKALDNLSLKTWLFETNKSGIASGADEQTVSLTGTGQSNASLDGNRITTGQFSTVEGMDSVPKTDRELSRLEKWNTSESLPDLYIKNDGMRYGRVTVCDYANNCSYLNIFANIDLTAPKVPQIRYVKKNSGQAYEAATARDYKSNTKWSKEEINAYPIENNTNEVSLIDYFNYSFEKQTGVNSWDKPLTGKILPGGSEHDTNYYAIADQGRHKFSVNACDKAGNCSDYSAINFIKIDTIKPTCGVKETYEVLDANNRYVTVNENPSNGSGWLKKGQRVILSHTCRERDANLSSGCDADNAYNKQSYTFGFDIDTEKAGANGYDATVNSELGDSTIGGHVVDYAGNMSDECGLTKVRIDTVAPKCTTAITWPKGEPINPDDGGGIETGWLGFNNRDKKEAVVSDVCDDSRSQNGSLAAISSGCDDTGKYDSNNYNAKTFTYKTEMNITNAGAGGAGTGGKVVDIAGNITICPADRTVKIDYTAPTCSHKTEYGKGKNASSFVLDNSIGNDLVDGWLGLVNDSSDDEKKMAKVSQVCKDNGTVKSGCFGDLESKIYDYEVNTTKASALDDGTGVPKVGSVKDRAGNEGNCNGNQTIRIDYTRPVCEVSASSTGSYTVNGTTYNWEHSLYNGEWVGKNGKVIITSTCTEAESGTGTSSGCATNQSKEYKNEMNVTNATSAGLGINAYVYDKAQNRSAACGKKTIKIDKTGPVCAVYSTYQNGNNHPVYYGEWLKGDKTVTVTSECISDNLADGKNGSGCVVSEASHDFTAEPEEVLNVQGGSGEEGEAYTLYDKVGNGTVCDTVPIKIDAEAPLCRLSATVDGAAYSGEWTKKNVLVSATCNDMNGSGCSDAALPSYSYGVAGNVYSSSKAGAGGPNQNAYISDAVGNVTTCPNNKTVRVDKKSPVCKITQMPPSETSASVQYLKTACVDSPGSGCEEPKNDTLTITPSSNSGTYTHVYRDKVGNSVTCNVPYSVNFNTASSVSCTFRVDYTVDGDSSNESVINVYGASSDMTVTYNNRGKNRQTNSDPVYCGQEYSGSITVRDGNNNSTTIQCGTVQTPDCCSSTYWKDGNPNGTPTCSATCGSGTYDQSEFSIYNNTYCDGYLESGGSACEVACTVYSCHRDGDHTPCEGWHCPYAWINLHSLSDTSSTSSTSIGIWVGHNSTLKLKRVVGGTSNNPYWEIVENGCGAADTMPSNIQSYKGFKKTYYSPYDYCSGWVLEGCTLPNKTMPLNVKSCVKTCS